MSNFSSTPIQHFAGREKKYEMWFFDLLAKFMAKSMFTD